MGNPAVQLVVGLGNPGPRYAETRHNVGFWFADRLASRYGATFQRAGRFYGELAQIESDGRLWLLKPDTYMNRSGQSLAAMARYYRYAPEQILVAHDELDLPPGTVRLKRGGGHGGHNGLRDIMTQFGARDFLRLRIGIGHPGSSDQVTNYVLSRASREDETLIDEAIDEAVKIFPHILDGNLEKAMHVLHSRKT